MQKNVKFKNKFCYVALAILIFSLLIVFTACGKIKEGDVAKISDAKLSQELQKLDNFTASVNGGGEFFIKTNINNVTLATKKYDFATNQSILKLDNDEFSFEDKGNLVYLNESSTYILSKSQLEVSNENAFAADSMFGIFSYLNNGLVSSISQLKAKGSPYYSLTYGKDKTKNLLLKIDFTDELDEVVENLRDIWDVNVATIINNYAESLIGDNFNVVEMLSSLKSSINSNTTFADIVQLLSIGTGINIQGEILPYVNYIFGLAKQIQMAEEITPETISSNGNNIFSVSSLDLMSSFNINDILTEDVLDYLETTQTEFNDTIDEICAMLNNDEFKLKTLVENYVENPVVYQFIEKIVAQLNFEKSLFSLNLHFDKKDSLKSISFAFNGEFELQESAYETKIYTADISLDFELSNFGCTQTTTPTNFNEKDFELVYVLDKEELVQNDYEFDSKVLFLDDFSCTLELNTASTQVISYNSATSKFKLGNYLQNFNDKNYFEYGIELNNLDVKIAIILE